MVVNRFCMFCPKCSSRTAGEATNAPARIEDLLRRNFHNIDPSVFDLRYQLLYATAGTVAVDRDLCVLLILVFKTHLYDELKALDNYRDYLQFIALADSSEILTDEGQAVAHQISVGGNIESFDRAQDRYRARNFE